MNNDVDGSELDEVEKSTQDRRKKILTALALTKSFIEFIGQHPFATGILAILGLGGFFLSIESYRMDREESKETTAQITDVNNIAKIILEKVDHIGRDWEVMDRAFYGIQVGGPVQPAYDLHFERILRKGSGTEKYIEWKANNSNVLSVTFDSVQDRVRKISLDWGGTSIGKSVGISDFSFGETTLKDIRDTFNSNGFSYAAKVMWVAEEGVVTLNAFELKDTPTIVIVFKTIISNEARAAIEKLSAEDQVMGKIGQYFKLIGIIVADESYLNEEWGRRKIYDPNSNPIELE